MHHNFAACCCSAISAECRVCALSKPASLSAHLPALARHESIAVFELHPCMLHVLLACHHKFAQTSNSRALGCRLRESVQHRPAPSAAAAPHWPQLTLKAKWMSLASAQRGHVCCQCVSSGYTIGGSTSPSTAPLAVVDITMNPGSGWSSWPGGGSVAAVSQSTSHRRVT